MPLNSLFRPFQCKTLKLPNRIVMAPMTRSFSPGGIPTPQVTEYYQRRAAAAVGLIISEGTVIQRPSASNDPNVPRFWGDALPAWKPVIDSVHAAGGVMAPQLWHVGAVRNRRTDWAVPEPIDSPSGLAAPGKPYGTALSDEAIADTIAAFARAAGDAKRLGYDAIELHGAHGYLIDQFFWDGTNQRSDGYGGATLPERGKFAADILRAVRAEVGPDYPVIIRLSQWKQQDYTVQMAKTPQEMEAWLQPLADAGADIFHCSQRRFWEPEYAGLDLNFAGWAKKLTGKPTITVGSVGLSGEFLAAFGGESSQPAPLDELLRRFDRGDFDLVAVGRALINDAQWVQKVRDGRRDELLDFSPAALGTLY